MKQLGIDMGSIFAHAVLLEDGVVAAGYYQRHDGDIRAAFERILSDSRFAAYDRAGVTGNFAADPAVVDGMLATVEGMRHLCPESRNALVIGGMSFGLVFFNQDGSYREHSVNPPCASGTGSFIEQQAARLGIREEELAERAWDYAGRIPRIATRCAVFAKSDIIHSMQEGHGVDAIAAGLCEGIARNVVEILVRGRGLSAPLAITGGVALNRRIVAAVGEMLGIETVVPWQAELVGAIGAARLGDLRTVRPAEFTASAALANSTPRPGLVMEKSTYPELEAFETGEQDGVEWMAPKAAPRAEAAWFAGFDIGSTSTKAVVMDASGTIHAGFYTRTSGRPVEAVTRLNAAISARFPAISLAATATTGSGRSMIKELFGAELEVNEISAHARAARQLMPQADTILEIGGQDSKFTLLRDGEVYFSQMNYVCAAGTGSFIDEQAKRLGVGLAEFSELAMGREAPYTSDRCTVYMERDLSVLMGQGADKGGLAAAVLHSVRDNYLAKVVNRAPIGDYVVFQGATARNRALVAAFEQGLSKPIHVSPWCHLTGAYGAALLVAMNSARDAVSGFRTSTTGFESREELCTLCANRCMLTVVGADGQAAAWGMKCGRDYQSRAATKKTARVSTFRTRHQSFVDRMAASSHSIIQAPQRRETVGVPSSLYHMEYGPLWRHLLEGLGFKVIAGESGHRIIEAGKSVVNSDFCAPMVLAHGEAKALIDRGADFLLVPALVNAPHADNNGNLPFRQKEKDSFFCYYSQYLPSILAKLTTLNLDGRLVSPLLFLNPADPAALAKAMADALCAQVPELDHGAVEAQMRISWGVFVAEKAVWKQEATRAFQAATGMKALLLGRPYAVYADSLSLGIPEKLEERGVAVFFQDELDCDGVETPASGRFAERMQWHYGHEILQAAELAAAKPDVFPVYLSCFRCSPDSFLIGYFKDILAAYRKPFLVLQLDEHASDIGYTTRIEAALNSFANHSRAAGFDGAAAVDGAAGAAPAAGAAGQAADSAAAARPAATRSKRDPLEPGDTVLVPYIGRAMSRFWRASFERAGYAAHVLDPGDRALSTGYLYANGGECMPAVAIAGGAIEKIRSLGLVPEHTWLYMPTLCMGCNFPQFAILADAALAHAGYPRTKIGYVNTMSPADTLPQTLGMKIFESGVVGSLLLKVFYATAAYETQHGAAGRALEAAEVLIESAIASGGDVRAALGQAAELFRAVAVDKSRPKPRIALLGDMYLKYNESVNQNVDRLIMEQGGEVRVPGFTETAMHFMDSDVRLYGGDPRSLAMLRSMEKRFEKIVEDLIPGQAEPDFAEVHDEMRDYGIRHYLPGETSVNAGRALHLLKRQGAEAIVHVNPMFCCPGVVSSSIFRKVQEDFAVPIVDIFYDGSGDQNRVLVPHLHYLAEAGRKA